MKNVILYGYYGHGNLGDEAILKSILANRILTKILKNSNISLTIFSYKAKEVASNYHINAINSDIYIWKPLRLIKQMIAILKCDLFILGGGGLLKDYGSSPKNLNVWLKWLKIAEILNKKIIIFAVGVENINFEKSKANLKKTLNKIHLITVRDSFSKQLLENLGIKKQIRIIPDPSILLMSSKTKSLKLIKPPRVLINVRHWFDLGIFMDKNNCNMAFFNTIANLINYLIDKHDATVDFIPMRITPYDDDRKIARKLIRMVHKTEKVQLIAQSLDVDSYLKLFGKYDLVIGMRLHSLIFASMLGIPTIALSYLPKIDAFMSSIGQEEYIFDLENLIDEDLINSIEKTFKNYSQRSTKILKYMGMLKNRIIKSIDNLSLLIEN